MAMTLQPLVDLRIPGSTNEDILLDGSPLRIVNHEYLPEDADLSALTVAIGTATVLYRWCPEALLALIDVGNWFSFTWSVTLQQDSPAEYTVEIGRIRNQITMGTLDKDGLWRQMLTFTISPLEDGKYQGSWVPNTEESMLGDENIADPSEVERRGREFVKDLVVRKIWLTGKKMKHEFFIESHTVGMDPFTDGVAMNPHWLYQGLDLTKCTTCESEKRPLSRCGRCGTASYCSSACQQKDWPVHKAVCSMSTEDRGKALHLTMNGGLVNCVQEEEHDSVDSSDEVADGIA
jgi:hypothetical protein